MNKVCEFCGANFESRRISTRFCSKECADRSRNIYKREQKQLRNEKLMLEFIRLYKTGKIDKEIAVKIGKSKTWCCQMRVKLGLPRQGLKKLQQKEAHKQDLAQMEVRFCKKCGTFFYPIRLNQIFCSTKCQRNLYNQSNDIKRKRLKDMSAADIPLDEVYRKYNGICYLCGGKCDFDDYEWVNGHKNVHGNYPSREHVIPLSKGGSHTWDNVKLAHIRCNSSKGVRCG